MHLSKYSPVLFSAVLAGCTEESLFPQFEGRSKCAWCSPSVLCSLCLWFFQESQLVYVTCSVPFKVLFNKVLSEMIDYLIHMMENHYRNGEGLEKLFHVNCCSSWKISVCRCILCSVQMTSNTAVLSQSVPQSHSYARLLQDSSSVVSQPVYNSSYIGKSVRTGGAYII